MTCLNRRTSWTKRIDPWQQSNLPDRTLSAWIGHNTIAAGSQPNQLYNPSRIRYNFCSPFGHTAAVPQQQILMNEIQGLSKEELVEKYTPLVRSIAAQLKSRLGVNLEFEELMSCGRLGLLEAAERFDYKLGVSFKTFAYYRIRGAMYDGLRKMEVITRRKDPRIKFEEAANQLMGSEAARTSVEARKPTLKDEIEEVKGIISALVPIYFLTSDALDQIKETEQANVEQQAVFAQEKGMLRQAMGKLSKNERMLIDYYYYQDMTLEEAAAKLGLSKSWASRLHAKALAKLKSSIHEKD
jgi:RNA polymerase sigma factor for flagellar operon FliA